MGESTRYLNLTERFAVAGRLTVPPTLFLHDY